MAETGGQSRHSPVLEVLLDRMPIGIGVLDRDLRVRDFNRPMAEFIARFAPVSFEQIVRGASLREVAPATADYLEPLCRRALTGETVRRDAIRLESNGEESFWDLVFQPLIEDGEITGVIDITTESTARVKASQLAETREHQFRQVFETTGDGIIINDPETGLVVEANPAACRMHGYEREEFIGLHPSAFIHPESMALFGQYLQTVRAGKVFRSRANDLRKDGTVLPVEVSGSMGEYQGRPHLVAVVRDIGEQLQSEQLLEQRVQERTRELEMLLDVSSNIASTRNLQHLIALILKRLRPVVSYAAAAVFLAEPNGQMRLLQHAGTVALNHDDGLDWLGKSQFLGSVAEPGTHAILDNVYADAPEAAAFRAEVSGSIGHVPGYLGTVMAVPLVFNDRLLGTLAFIHTQPGYYTDQHAALAVAFANQAAAAIDNARLFDELTTNSRELATLLSVASSLSSTLDFDRLVDLVLDELKHLIDYTGCGIVRVIGEEIVVVSSRAVGGARRPISSGLRMKLNAPGDLWHRVLSGEPVMIDDVRGGGPAAREYRAVVGDYRNTVFAAVRSWMAIPLMVNDRVFGMLTVSRDVPAFFTEHDRQLAEALAGQASIALSNATLFTEAETRRQELATLLEVSRNITSTLELGPLLSAVLEQLHLTLHYAGATIFELDGTELRALAAQRLGDPGKSTLRTYALANVPVNRRVIEQKAPVIIDDIHGDSPIAQTLRSAWDEELADRLRNVHSWMGVPLMARDRVIGMLSIEHMERGHFGQQHASLAMAFANQAATAIDNARLFAEAEKRARQMEALSRISSTLALDQPTTRTLDAIAGHVVEATRAVGCSVVLISGDIEFELYGASGAVSRDLVGAMHAAIRGGAVSPTVGAWGSQKRRVVHHARTWMLEQSAYAPTHRFLEGADWENVVIVPMIYHGAALGTLNTYYPAGYEPDAEELSLVSAIADQASVAIDNRRLFAETERRAREVDALYRADERLHQSLLLADVLEALVDVTTGILEADKSLVVITDPKSGRLHVAAHRGYAASTIAGANDALAGLPGSGFVDRAQPVVVENAETDRRAIRQVVDPERIKSFVDVPIAIAGQIYGIVDLAYTSSRHFSPDDLRTFVAFAQRAGVAIENARLYERSQRAASLEERQRLARELHDSVSQALYGIALGARTARTQLDRDPAQASEPLDYVLSLAEAGLAELRSLIFELRPESLEAEGLVAAFTKQFEAVRARHGIEVIAHLGIEPAINVAMKEALYRIGQEAMNNTVKHARASSVEVTLASDAAHVVLEIRDDGVGFDPGGDFPGHMGLQSMAERASGLGATLDVESSPGHGTVVRVRLPLGRA